MMSMKSDGKPVSSDCAVRREDLAEYARRLTEIFEAWHVRDVYARIRGCLHVRPILNMKEEDARKDRAIVEETLEMVHHAGSHSEHGMGSPAPNFIA